MIDLMLGALCEVRGPGHYNQHGGLEVDSAYHVAHGGKPTCKGSSDKAEYSSSDESGPADLPSRDSFGFHCTWRGCG